MNTPHFTKCFNPLNLSAIGLIVMSTFLLFLFSGQCIAQSDQTHFSEANSVTKVPKAGKPCSRKLYYTWNGV